MPAIRSFGQQVSHWRTWVRQHSAVELKQKDLQSLGYMRALRPVIVAFLEAGRLHQLVLPEDQSVIRDVLENWEDASFVTRFATFSVLSEIYDLAMNRKIDCASDLLALFAHLYHRSVDFGGSESPRSSGGSSLV
jgi:hypothetical protein